MPVTVRFDPTSVSKQAQIIPDATVRNAGVMTPAQVAQLNAGGVAPGGITTEFLANEAVTTEKIANDAVTGTQIAGEAVDFDQLATESVRGNRIQDRAIGGTKIATDAIFSTVFEGGNGIGPVLVPNLPTGTAISINNITTPGNALDLFSANINVAGQIQQTADSNLNGQFFALLSLREEAP